MTVVHNHTRFHDNLLKTFHVILAMDKWTDTDEHITSLAEVKVTAFCQFAMNNLYTNWNLLPPTIPE